MSASSRPQCFTPIRMEFAIHSQIVHLDSINDNWGINSVQKFIVLHLAIETKNILDDWIGLNALGKAVILPQINLTR